MPLASEERTWSIWHRTVHYNMERKGEVPTIPCADLISTVGKTASSHFYEDPDVDKRTLGIMASFLRHVSSRSPSY